MKIWELTACENDYNCTPDVVKRWNKKPSMELLAEAMRVGFPSSNDEITLSVVKCWQGGEVRPHSCGDTFSLKEVEVVEL
jgi:hypothetical protein